MMRWAVVGSSGMFGREMLEYLSAKNEDAVGFNRLSIRAESSVDEIAALISGFDVLVNAAGFTAVDLAETELFETNSVNAIFAGKLAQAAAEADVRFMHISTDYVFDGFASQPYRVIDQVDPQTAYGESKALGEKLVAESGADYSILRTAWLYSAGGKNFAKTIASILKSQGQARVVSDQSGQPTWAADLARVVFDVAQLKDMPRIIHATASGSGSWADFAREIAEALGMSSDSVVEVSSSEFETAAKRPAYSVLDNSSSVIEPIGDWRERWAVAAQEVLREFL
jgi:dTDP-4-dehydrorhamnose reductase